MKTIPEFHELTCPACDDTFNASANATDWCCHDSDKLGLYWLLSDGSLDLADLLSIDTTVSIFYFDTEVLAHTAAWEYYASHSKAYPFMKEFNDAIRDEDSENSEITGQQTMKFL